MSFTGMRKIWFLFSAVLIIIGLASLAINGLNYGIDFTGGTIVHLNIGQQFTMEEVRGVLEPLGLEGAVVQKVGMEDVSEGEQQELLIKSKELTAAQQDEVFDAFQARYDLSEEDLLRVENVGAVVGNELKRQALLALLIASIGMVIYITFRFEFRFAITAIAALLHDALVVLAFFSLFHVEVNGPFIAAILTILGYSINDTIVIFDRIRENLKNRRKEQLSDVVEKSIRQTLQRSINTSATTLLVLITLFIFGGVTLRPFISALLVGVSFGTYSSIFIASPLWLTWKEMELRKTTTAKTA
jgi:preprotein translocase SecF subunit